MIRSLWPDSQAPAVTNQSDGGAAGITTGTLLLFGNAFGKVLGVRFRATTTVVGSETYTVGLWQNSTPDVGVLLASKSVLGSTIVAGAWNSVSFNAPVSVDNTHAYVVGVWNSAGRYVATSAYFVGHSEGSLSAIYAPSNGENINAIVGSGFASSRQALFRPNQAFDVPTTTNGASYFVDVLWDDGLNSDDFFSFF